MGGWVKNACVLIDFQKLSLFEFELSSVNENTLMAYAFANAEHIFEIYFIFPLNKNRMEIYPFSSLGEGDIWPN